MKILLVMPAPFEPGRLGLENVLWLSEPVALTSLAAMVPNHEVRILDMRLEPDMELNRVLLEFRPDIVGTTSMTTDCYQAKAVLQLAKGVLGPNCFTIVGGHHPTLAPGDFYDQAVDALCIGEGELTFLELVSHLQRGKSKTDLAHIPGLQFRKETGEYATSPKRSQNWELEKFPLPARHLIPVRYRQEYFFCTANPMASIETSRGCSYNCNFCAIWEFYERKTRFLSAGAICDRLETIPEKFVFFLDDNFLTKKSRLEALCDEIQKRRIKKYFGIQGRSDFVAENPDLMRRLRDAGLMMVLSGFESNDDNALEALRKDSTRNQNKEAAKILRRLGIVSTGIFMVRQDFEEADFDRLFETINEMGIAIPLVTILTPLPGTELWRKREKDLLTKDIRLFDLLHSVLPTKMPREMFYARYTQWHRATLPGVRKGIFAAVFRRPKLFLWDGISGVAHYIKKIRHYAPIIANPFNHLRDEIGIIDQSVTLSTLPPEPPLLNQHLDSAPGMTHACA